MELGVTDFLATKSLGCLEGFGCLVSDFGFGETLRGLSPTAMVCVLL